MLRLTGAQALVRVLAAEQVPFAFGIVGGKLAPLMHALAWQTEAFGLGPSERVAFLAGFALAGFTVGLPSSASSTPLGCRPRAAFASFTLASRAAMRSTTFSAVGAAGASTTSFSPAALRSMSSSTCSR